MAGRAVVLFKKFAGTVPRLSSAPRSYAKLELRHGTTLITSMSLKKGEAGARPANSPAVRTS